MTRQGMFAACALAAVAFTGCQDQRRNAGDRLDQGADELSQAMPGQDGYAGNDTQPEQDLNRTEDDALGSTQGMDDPYASGDAAIGGSGAATSLSGDVKSASADALTVSDPQGKEVEIQLDDNTRFHSADGQSLAATDISEGDQVRASFEDRGGEKVATDVTVTQAKNGTGGSGIMDDAKEGMDDVRQGAEDAWDNTKEGARDVKEDVENRF